MEVDGSDVSLSATNPVAVSGMAVTLTLANGVGIGKTVEVSYTVPTSNPIQDSAGNDAGALMDRSVTVGGICDRTPAVQTAILEEISGITDCGDVTSSHLSGIPGPLNLYDKSLTSLQEKDFDGLSGLYRLYLNRNSLSSLPEDIFDGLSTLIDLYLYKNSLRSLPEGIFDGLSNLQELFLYDNSLSSLGGDIFDGLSNLGTLSLNNNSLSSLGGDTFDGLSNLRTLHLYENSLSSVGEDIFDGLSNLGSLNLADNSLSSLHEEIFDGLTSLQSLYLQNNSLRSLPQGLLSNTRLPSLTFLRLGNNGLVCLPRDLAGRPSPIIQPPSLRNLPDCYGVSLSVSPAEVSEGSGGESITVTAALKDGNRVKSVATTVTISVDSGTATEGTDFTMVSDFTITIASGSSSNSGTFTLTATDDSQVEESETVKVTGRTSLSNSSVAGTQVSDAEVRINDAVGLSTTTLTLEEGESGTYTVVLNRLPTGNVSITPSSDDSGAASTSPATLTFTTANWNTAQTVTITAAQDDDDQDETVTVGHSISGYGSISGGYTVTVTVRDDDGVAISPTSLTLEEGESGSYTVVLEGEPTGTVTITPSSSDTTVATVTPSSLTFTTSNWNTVQTVTVSGVEDIIASEDQTIAVSHGISGGGYGSVSVAHVTVTVNDDDTARVRVSQESLSILEGESGSYTVVLNTQPTGTVTITPGSGDTTVATVTPSSLTFTTSNWNTVQTVTVSGVEDIIASEDQTIAVSHGISGGGYGSVSVAHVTVTVNDDDTARVRVSQESLSILEGESGSYTVVLNTQPTGTVTITPGSGDTTVATVTPSSLTFTTSNWNTVQTVTVSGVEDIIASEDQTIAVSHGISGGGYGSVSVAHVTVTVNDDDTARVRVSQESLSILEGESGSYTVVLNTQPTGTVTITPGSGDTTVATVTPSSLTFTTSNWNTVQTVRVSSVENDVASEDQTITVSHGISGGGYGSVSVAHVTVTVNDDDTARVRVSQESLSILEGEGGSYTVVLNTQPTGTVTITPGSGDTTVATVTPASLTFTTANWDTAQTVTVTGVEDDDAGNETVTISHSVRGYGSVSTANGVTVTVNDDETAGVKVDPTTLSMEEGESGTYMVKLESQPSGSVTITPFSDNSDVRCRPTSLTFSRSNWNGPQTMTVIVGQGDDNEDETAAILHSVRGYGSISSGDTVTVTVRDDDEATGEAVIQAWLPRFGRSVAQQVVERVSRRLQQRPQPGLEVSVAGEQLTNRGPWEEEQGIMAKLLGFETVSEGQLVEGTEFAFSPSQPHGEADADGEGVEDGNGEGNGSGDGEGLAFWGAGDLSSFNGQQDTISLSGDVTTALVGADWQRQRWQAGAALAHSWGSGSYEESSREGRLNANLMGLFPYGRYALNPKLTLWGVVGHGWGRLSLLPEDGEQQSTAIQMSMGAVGLDGLLLDGGGSGLTIRSTADALLLRVNSQETEDLAGIQGEVSRLRLGLEAERPFPLSESGAVLTPSLELALRQDGGDAETGFGLDLAAALLWSDPGKGLEVELSGHTLLSHGDAAFHEKGLAASLAWDPNPSSSLGPSLSLSQSMGASAGSGGNDALLAAANWPELETSTRGSAGEDHQFAARLGYGFLAYRDALLITPKLGVALSGDGATTTLGFSLSPYSQEGYSYPWQLSLERQHSNGNSDDPTTQHSLDLRFSLLF